MFAKDLDLLRHNVLFKNNNNNNNKTSKTDSSLIELRSEVDMRLARIRLAPSMLWRCNLTDLAAELVDVQYVNEFGDQHIWLVLRYASALAYCSAYLWVNPKPILQTLLNGLLYIYELVASNTNITNDWRGLLTDYRGYVATMAIVGVRESGVADFAERVQYVLEVLRSNVREPRASALDFAVLREQPSSNAVRGSTFGVTYAEAWNAYARSKWMYATTFDGSSIGAMATLAQNNGESVGDIATLFMQDVVWNHSIMLRDAYDAGYTDVVVDVYAALQHIAESASITVEQCREQQFQILRGNSDVDDDDDDDYQAAWWRDNPRMSIDLAVVMRAALEADSLIVLPQRNVLLDVSRFLADADSVNVSLVV